MPTRLCIDCEEPLPSTVHHSRKRCAVCRRRHRQEYHCYRYSTVQLPKAADLRPAEIERRYQEALKRLRAQHRHGVDVEAAWAMRASWPDEHDQHIDDLVGCGSDALFRPLRLAAKQAAKRKARLLRTPWERPHERKAREG
jgi:Lon protease-like protein